MIKKLALLLVIAMVVASYFIFDGQQYVSVGYFQQAYEQDPWLTAGIFFLCYFLAAAFSLPAAALLTVIAGMIFGFGVGTALSSFASSLGATLACFFSRYLLRDWVSKKLDSYSQRVNNGLERDGSFYLFSLRLIPVIPFWTVNMVFGLTRLSLLRFYVVSQLGMLAGTMIYVNAGAQLGAVEKISLQGVLTPGVIGSLLLLACFPYIVKLVMAWRHRRQVYADFKRPAHFDTNLVVIGGGSAGLVTAYLAAALKAKVTLVEKHQMGGDCLNTGCVPSKSLLRAAKAAHEVRTASKFGVNVAEPEIDFSRVMAHVRGAIDQIAPHDSMERYRELGVDCVQGKARIMSPWEVDVDGQRITARHIVIASGARPRVPDLPGLESIAYLTSESLWLLESLPARLLIVGGGPVGCEIAQAFQRLGSRVTLLQRNEHLLPKTDKNAAKILEECLINEGVEVLTSSQVTSFSTRNDEILAKIDSGGCERIVVCDRVLLALGRQPNTANLGLEALNLACNVNGTLQVNEYLQTRFPNVYGCGDVVGPYQFTHASAHQAWYAAVNALFGSLWKFKVDYRLMPSVVYTDPEIASVGLTEQLASQQSVDFEITKYEMSALDRGVTDRATTGFVKILTPAGKDKILGVTIVGTHAGEMLTEFVVAMKQGKGLNFILSTIHPYPVYGEANKLAAGQWKRSHTPERVLGWVEKYHRRQLGRRPTKN